jgi:hypothetical protein
VKTALTLAFLALLLPAAALAQPSPFSGNPVSARLSGGRMAAIEPGRYSAGEGREFTIAPYRGKYLLRFSNIAESFVLTADPGSLGAKLLKYDTGAAALSVSAWGGITLYAADAPGGLPATHQGAAGPANPIAVSATELRSALSDEAAHFSYAGDLTLTFVTDAATLSEAEARAMAFDTLAIVQSGIERFIATPAGKRAVSRRVSTVKLEKHGKPGVTLSGRTLLVRYAPQDGYLGRVSSHAVAHHLGKLLAVTTPE